MRKIKEALRLHSLGLKQQQIASSCCISQSTVSEYLQAAQVAGLNWPEMAGLDERELAARLFPERVPAVRRGQYPPLDFAAIHQELQAHKHVTLQLLWEEYRQNCPNGYRYSRFCELYHRWRSQAGCGPAPATPRRREGVRRLGRRHRPGVRPQDRRAAARLDLRGGAGRHQLHLRRSRAGRRACRTGSARTSTPSSSSAACRRSRSRITPRPA